jgi:hypothetical protein
VRLSILSKLIQDLKKKIGILMFRTNNSTFATVVFNNLNGAVANG